jgi:hypothetical protein
VQISTERYRNRGLLRKTVEGDSILQKKRATEMIRRRTFFKFSGAALAGGALLLPTVSSAQSPRDDYETSPKDPRFGAVGNSFADDTAAIQAAADDCFGSSSAPHGTAKANLNKVLCIPRGNYRITSPIRLVQLRGGRILGAGRFATKITNSAGGPVFVTNGCEYSHFEGMCLESSGKTATIFDLNWDGTAGGAALQSNTFIDMFFSGGSIGVDIGADGHMGSENIFINCFVTHQATAGIKTSNFNALQNTIIGGNFQDCNIGIWVYQGSTPVVESVGFQMSEQWDIRVDNSANDTLTVIGCRSESSNFIKIGNSVHAYIAGCEQLGADPAGYFLQPAGCPVTVERCVSVSGQICLSADARLTIRGCSFGRGDWLSYSPLNSGQSIEIEDVQYGGTPNSKSIFSSAGRIIKQRITSAGIFEYNVTAV